MTAAAGGAGRAALSASQIVSLLAERHAGDVFVPECKDGPTQGYGPKLRILDAWVMRKSWSQWTTLGYEIKVSRSDFLGDDKWSTYLDLCHEFYFVAPPGVIQLAELPADVGLIETTKNGKRLLTRRKAVVRKIEPPIGVLSYVLMWRARIEREHKSDKLAYWREWLATKGERREVGLHVATSLSKIVFDLRARASAAERAAERNESIEKTLRELGIDPDKATPWSLKAALADRSELRRKCSYHLEALEKILGGDDE